MIIGVWCGGWVVSRSSTSVFMLNWQTTTRFFVSEATATFKVVAVGDLLYC
jgi:hypothetical protein